MSPRPPLPRRCCCSAGKRCGIFFKPAGRPGRELERIPLFVDELEAFDLCDRQGLTQEEAGGKMGVSRGTVQRLLANARLKVAEALTQGKALMLAPVESGKPASPRKGRKRPVSRR